MIWEKDRDTTYGYKALVDITQIMDRSGTKGTRLPVYKAILHAYSTLDQSQRTDRLISRVLILDATYCATQEPELMDESLEDYAFGLYRELGLDV